MSKSWKISIVVISTIIFIAAGYVLPLLVFGYIDRWSYNADFENYESDFCVVREYVGKRFASEDGKWVAVAITDKYDRALYDPDTNEYVDVPDNVRDSLKTIDVYGFPDKDSNLDIILIQGDRVSFNIENGRYALVYSPNKKPTWVGFHDEQEDIKVKKINADWYHVVKISK